MEIVATVSTSPSEKATSALTEKMLRIGIVGNLTAGSVTAADAVTNLKKSKQ